MDKPNDSSADYIKMIVFVFIGLGAFIVAILSAYFGGVGLYFGQGIVETDVFTEQYKYECLVLGESPCTAYNTSATLDSYADYQVFRDDINSTVPLYINATTVIFSLLGLVFLFLALRSAGLFGKVGGKKEGDLM